MKTNHLSLVGLIGFVVACFAISAASQTPETQPAAEASAAAQAPKPAEELNALRKRLDNGWQRPRTIHIRKSQRSIDHRALMDALRAASSADPLRIDAIALARQYCVPAEMRARHAGEHFDNRYRLEIAWRILESTDVLHEGMRLETAVAILGKPTGLRKTHDGDGVGVHWYYPTRMHVNPLLLMHVKDGKVVELKVTVG